ncbi:EF-hand domain-containing protein [Sphingomonas sp. KR3-1]|uniref:EF-hand domain-containing protein n=1 Tax=Sphingomonas sp. KR3-1 TaxID=3156611 RepID=UPI0032B5728D
MLDERMRAAIARLTDNEKECLRRRLLPQTAKEMALELGVSPHAVEKRIKMARTKLGLSSSLQAARLLALAESQPLVPQPADLAAPAAPPQADPAPGDRRRWWMGGIAMSIIIAAVLALTLRGAPAPQDTPEPAHKGKRYEGPWVPATPEQAEAFLGQSFDIMDRDKSGYLEAGELPVTSARVKIGDQPFRKVSVALAKSMYLEHNDRNGDGKVSRDEYIAAGRARVAITGIPANWKPRS